MCASDAAVAFCVPSLTPLNAMQNHDIRRITLASSTVTKLAGSYLTAACTDGIGASSAFNGPVSVAQSSSGFALVVSSGCHPLQVYSALHVYLCRRRETG